MVEELIVTKRRLGNLIKFVDATTVSQHHCYWLNYWPRIQVEYGETKVF